MGGSLGVISRIRVQGFRAKGFYRGSMGFLKKGSIGDLWGSSKRVL